MNNDIKTENLFYSGLILGFSNFNQSIDNYTIYNTNSTYWGESYIDESLSLSNLNAVWFEIVFGLKTEIFNNLFLGFELQLKNVLKQKNSQGITNFIFLDLTEHMTVLILVLALAILSPI